MEVKPGYKQSDVGIIPEDWEVKLLPDVCRFRGGKAHEQYVSEDGRYVCVNSKFISTDGKDRKYASANFCPAKKNDILMVMSDLPNGRALAKTYLVDQDNLYAVNQRVCALTPYRDSSRYLFYVLNRNPYFLRFDDGVNQTHLLNPVFQRCPLPLPRNKAEQEAIAEVLSDADAHIESLEQLIAKKRYLIQGAMQELLTGKRRLPGFGIKTGYKQAELGVIPEDWDTKTLQQTTDCLDNLRVPLNESERLKRQGDIPYCGANGVLDYIDDFVIDDDIILMAEDGGYFDEYLTRPIAYRMTGKCWVNNHAHILKAKSGLSQGFIYYCLVHKDILRFLASGTRAKLNRSELNKIEIPFPPANAEQETIASILSDMDTDICALEDELTKARQIKQGMMQELLTGRIRLL
jgi:type I restriction enzyme, S subunit